MTTLYKLPDYEQHPIAVRLMPGGMSDSEFDAFCEDVKERGIMNRVTLYQGKVLDGWHRYRAAKKTGSRVDFREYKGNDPEGWVVANNVHRRRLTSLQRALVGARLHRDKGTTQRDVCRKLAISNEVLSLAVKLLESNNTALIRRIETDGEFSRGQLREEMQDAGLLQAKPANPVIDPTTIANSVFDIARVSAPPPEEPPAPEEPGDDDEDINLGVGTGLTGNKAKIRKPSTGAINRAAKVFLALTLEEQMRMITAVWPNLRKLATENQQWVDNLLPLHGQTPPAVKEPARKLAPTNKPARKPAPLPPGKPARRPAAATPAPARRPAATPLQARKPAAPAPARKPAPVKKAAPPAKKVGKPVKKVGKR